jgi:hypothetical protein
MFVKHYGIPVYPTQTTANRTIYVMMVLCVVLLAWAVASSLGGCQGKTPARVAYISVEASGDVVQGVKEAYALGLISREQVAALLPYTDAVKQAQDSINTAMLSGSSGYGDYAKALTEATTDLLNRLSAAKRAKATATQPTTQPH